MSLREEIAAYFSILEPAREERADEIINKVLDAAVEAAKREKGTQKNANKWPQVKHSNAAIDNVIEAIQRLKEGK